MVLEMYGSAQLEAHQRLKTNQPCPELSWSDLETQALALKDVDKSSGRISNCLTVLKQTGARYYNSEGREDKGL
uniref:Uncharacterized protein n=1 Tax=Oryza meridionalis TaxID=40149 RepID=A0A0E0CTZ2_9ORYZ